MFESVSGKLSNLKNKKKSYFFLIIIVYVTPATYTMNSINSSLAVLLIMFTKFNIQVY